MTKTAADAPAATDALEIRDTRTGKSYTAPIADGVIRASDLRQVKVDADDFGPYVRTAAHIYGAAMARGPEMVVQRCEIMQTGFGLMSPMTRSSKPIASLLNRSQAMLTTRAPTSMTQVVS